MADEVWRAVPGSSGIYEVSSYGRMRRVKKTSRNTLAGTFSRGCIDKKGYIRVSTAEMQKRYHLLHRLVALSFLGPAPHGKTHVNHKNGNPADNRIDNLEYVTPGENLKHAVEVLGVDFISGRLGELHWRTSLKEGDIRLIRKLYRRGKNQHDTGNAKQLAKRFKTTQGNIYNIVRRRCWGHVE